MTYKGVEDIRFTPGWGDSTKQDYWSYAYLWWLDGNQGIDAAGLQQNLQLYYTGLVNRNVINSKIPENKVVPTEAAIKKIKTAAGDIQTFRKYSYAGLHDPTPDGIEYSDPFKGLQDSKQVSYFYSAIAKAR